MIGVSSREKRHINSDEMHFTSQRNRKIHRSFSRWMTISMTSSSASSVVGERLGMCEIPTRTPMVDPPFSARVQLSAYVCRSSLMSPLLAGNTTTTHHNNPSPQHDKDDLGAFEAAMSFLLHWGSRLLVTFPQPPVPVLAGMELALRRVDPKLASHLEKLSIGALSYGWPLLRSAFSEVLSRDDWLRLLDRLLAYPDQPELLEAAAVGFVVASRVSLLECRSPGEAEAFFRRPPMSKPPSSFRCGTGEGQGGGNAVDVDEMFRVMHSVARFGAPDRRSSATGNGDKTAAALALLLPTPRQFRPLPKGRYPTFDGYPQFVMNYQEELRERVARQERDVDRKRQLVRTLILFTIVVAAAAAPTAAVVVVVAAIIQQAATMVVDRSVRCAAWIGLLAFRVPWSSRQQWYAQHVASNHGL